MMGRKLVPRERAEIINLEEFVPRDHLLRMIDRYLDLAEFRTHLKPFYSHTGRPSVDPELIIHMLIIGYCYGIRSERRLCEARKIARSIHEDARNVARHIMNTPGYWESRR